MLRSTLLLTLVLLAGAPATAGAVIVGWTGEVHTRDRSVATGGPGPDTIAAVRGSDGWSITAQSIETDPPSGAPCAPTAPLTVLCPPQAASLWLDGGGGDDDLRVHGPGLSFAVDRLDGGPGDDRVQGGDARERITLSAGRDVLDGGGGLDTLVTRSGELAVDLAARRAVQGDADATVTGIENVEGAGQHGVVRGDAGPNDLSLASGTVSGGAGDDRLTGARVGAEDPFEPSGELWPAEFLPRDGEPTGGTVDAGAGDDVLRPGADWRVRCGSGDDVVELLAKATRLSGDCEALTYPVYVEGRYLLRLDPRPRVHGRALHLRLACPRDSSKTATPARCRGTVSIPALGRRAKASFSAASTPVTVLIPTERRLRPGRLVTVGVAVRREKTSFLSGGTVVRSVTVPVR